MNKLKIVFLAAFSVFCISNIAVASENLPVSNPEKFCMGLLDNNGFSELKKNLSGTNNDIKIAMGLALRESYRALVDNAMHKTKSKLANFDDLKYRNSVYNVILTEIQRAMLGIGIYQNGSVQYNQCNYDELTAEKKSSADLLLKLKKTDGFLDQKDYHRCHVNYVLLINLIDRTLNSKKKENSVPLIDICNALIAQGCNADLVSESFSDIKKYCEELGLYDYLQNLRDAHKIAINTEFKKDKSSDDDLHDYYSTITNFVKKLPGIGSCQDFFNAIKTPISFSDDNPVYPGIVYRLEWLQEYSIPKSGYGSCYILYIGKIQNTNPEIDLMLYAPHKTDIHSKKLEKIKGSINQSELLRIIEHSQMYTKQIDKAVTEIINVQTQKAISNSFHYKKSVAEALDNLYNVSCVTERTKKRKITSTGWKEFNNRWITDFDRPFIWPLNVASTIDLRIDELKKMMGDQNLVSCIRKEYGKLVGENFDDIATDGETTKYAILF